MQLWNDYEGKVIADVYSVGSLLRPEGRSALFELQKGPDAPAIIRLTESLNDEGLMLAAWRRISDLKQENIVKIKRFGETTFAATPLTYAVLEPVDAYLGDLLKDRALTHEEAMQMARSVATALSALHANGFVHEHIDPDYVVAIGETVKLRGDCARELASDPDCTTPEESNKLLQRDVRDFGMLLVRSLTLQKKYQPTMLLAAPFDKIIRHALDGTWGMGEIARLLAPPVPIPATNPVPVQVPAQSGATAKPQATPPMQPTLAFDAAPVVNPAEQETTAADPLLYRRRVETGTAAKRKLPLLAGLGGAAVLIVAVLIHSSHSNSGAAPVNAAVTASQVSPKPLVKPVSERNPQVTRTAPVTQAQAASGEQAPSTGRVRPGWYVIAYTFNHEQQAWSRAAAILKQHPYLHPQVIAPGGASQFLVALGGPMSRDEAENTRRMAREAGLPRDTFVRNYKAG
jgi:hypothetical protein